MSYFDEKPFDASTVDPAGEFKPLPEGVYEFLITNASEAKTKDGQGLMGVFELQVTRGDHKGRKLTKRVNLRNANPQAVQIGQGELSAICRAIKNLRPKNWQAFVGQTLSFKVVVKPYNGSLSNEVKNAVLDDTEGADPAPAAAEGPAWG